VPVSRVLLIAPTCDRDDVGEAWVAYQWAAGLAQRHDLTVLTYHKRGRATVASQLPGVRVIEWTEPAALGRAERLNSMLKPGYLPFYRHARAWIKQALAAGERFDVAHQPVPVAMRYPSPAAGLGIPLVIGPVGGSLSTPRGFADEDTAPWYVKLRGLDGLRLRHDPLLNRTYREAACVLGIAPYVRSNLEGVPLRRFEVMGETGLLELPAPIDRSDRDGRLVRLLFVGRLIRTKGARDAIAALTELGDLPLHLDIVGDGFDRAECERLVVAQGLQDRVTFHGRQDRDRVAEFYRAADIFVFPSYREPGGNVMFEAMGASLPQIVSDRGGPGAAVDDSCGIRLPALDPEQYRHAIAGAIRELATDQPRRLELGRAALRRLAVIGLWESKLDAAEQIYRSCQGS
jgi:glycosyltransferase involved in cell wall biosynthesis